jgi:hypothetical protein
MKVLMTTSWPRISQNTAAVATAVADAQAGGLIEVRFDEEYTALERRFLSVRRSPSSDQ